MHRLLSTSLIASLALLLGLAGFSRIRLAREATPPADAAIAVVELAPGVTAEIFGASPSVLAPGQTLYLARYTLQPGDEIFPHCHPGTTLLGVESGVLGWTLVEGTAQVTRGAATGATEPTETLSEPESDVILNPGDAIYYEDDVVHTARGAGDEPAIVHGTLLLETGAPLLVPADQMADEEGCAPAA